MSNLGRHLLEIVTGREGGPLASDCDTPNLEKSHNTKKMINFTLALNVNHSCRPKCKNKTANTATVKTNINIYLIFCKIITGPHSEFL